MKNLTINIPEIYDKNIQKLIGMKLVPNRSEAVRTALREYLQEEYDINLDLLGYFDTQDEKYSFWSTNLPKKNKLKKE